MFRWVRSNFITGLLIVLPIAGTIYILFAFFSAIDSIVSPLIEFIFGREIYGLGVLLAFGLIIFTGVFGKNYIGRKLFDYSEKLMVRIPLVRPVYTTVKQFLNAIFIQNSTSAFKQVVIVEYPRKGLYQLGFLTGNGFNDIHEKTGEEILTVFLPTTPNPTSGMLIMVPKKDVVFLDLSIEEGIKIILSGGVLTPDRKRRS